MKKALPSFLLCIIVQWCSAQGNNTWSGGNVFFTRTYNAVAMLSDSIIVAAGGNKFNDAIRSVSQSNNLGQSWNVIVDIPHFGWIKAIDFTSFAIGFATGDTGTFIRTHDGGVTWDSVVMPGIAAHRDFNGIFFLNTDTGFLAGGLPSGNAMQTILRTYDGGSTWTIQSDTAGPQLNDIYFINSQTGFAAGDSGVLLSTVNGGTAWSTVSVPGNLGNRDLRAIKFTGSTTGVIVGGTKDSANDYEVILQTTNGGANWNLISNTPGLRLNAVQFFRGDSAIAVGDSGVVLFTADGGSNWSRVNLPDTVDDWRDLYAISFANPYFGMAVGLEGKALIYHIDSFPSPVVTLGMPIYVQMDSVILNGTVDVKGVNSQIIFELGTNLPLISGIAATPSPLSSSSNMLVQASAGGLPPHIWYYYDIEVSNAYGTFRSAVDSFYGSLTEGEISNWGFEFWDSVPVNSLYDWYCIGNVQKVRSYDGSNAVKLSSYTPDSISYYISAVLNAFPGGGGTTNIPGGSPFTARPDSLKGYFNYNITPGDTGVVLVGFKTAGVMRTLDRFWITGNSGGAFVLLSFPITYQTGDIPDTIFVGFANSSIFSNTSISPNNVLMVDNISFTGTNQNVPDPGFENWDSSAILSPVSWINEQLIHGHGYIQPFQRSADRYSGNYALEMQSDTLQNINILRITSQGTGTGNQAPDFSLHHRPVSLNGFFKYFPQYGDTMVVQFCAFYQDSMIGYARFQCDTEVNQFTAFSAPVNYSGTYAGQMPDSGYLVIQQGYSGIRGNDRLIIDAISFDGLTTPDFGDTATLTSIENTAVAPAIIKIYPNPAASFISLNFQNFATDFVAAEILNMAGQLIDRFFVKITGSDNTVMLDASRYPAGMYLLRVKNSEEYLTGKFIKVSR